MTPMRANIVGPSSFGHFDQQMQVSGAIPAASLRAEPRLALSAFS
jgi:hypothetical protein